MTGAEFFVQMLQSLPIVWKLLLAWFMVGFAIALCRLIARW